MTFTIDGREEIANWLGGASSANPSHTAVGDDDTLPTESDTSLGNEIFRKSASTSVSGQTAEFEMTLLTTDLVGSTIKEMGLLNASSGGDLFVRTVNADIDKTANFEVRLVTQIKVR
tara:strand:+ start:3407 stop:3757 length:351 start_codon:yes stop_codon:yes gene_type:complete